MKPLTTPKTQAQSSTGASKKFCVLSLLAFGMALMASVNVNAQCVQATSNSTTATPFTGSVSNPGNAYDQADGNITTAATLTINFVADAALTVTFDQNANKGDSIIVMYGVPTANVLNFASLATCTLTPFSGTNGAGTASTAAHANQLTFIVTEGSNSLARLAIPVTAAAGAQSIKIDFLGLGVAANVQTFIYDVAVKPGPLTITAQTICNGTPATLTASGNALAAQPADVLWYDADGTTVLQTNSNLTGAPYSNTYTTAALTATKTFYARERWNGCSLLSDPTPVVVTVRPAITPNISIICGTPVRLSTTTTGATAPVTYAWTASASGHIVSGATTASPVINHVGTYTVTLTDANSCTGTASAPFSVNDCVALPVKLLSFVAAKNGGHNLLTWTTADEDANSDASFDVERSNDGKNWNRAGAVNKLQSYKDGQAYYSFNDKQQVANTTGDAYYRLKMYEDNGTYTYSPVRVIGGQSGAELSLYPNPVKPGAALNVLFGAAGQAVSLTLVDGAGKKVYQGPFTAQLNVQHLTPGLYTLILLQADGSVRSCKFSKE